MVATLVDILCVSNCFGQSSVAGFRLGSCGISGARLIGVRANGMLARKHCGSIPLVMARADGRLSTRAMAEMCVGAGSCTA
jgi:hypothetical protein